MAKESLDSGKKVVIVGGNSVAMGKGQGKDLWTEKLQNKLGPEYKVLNFAQSLMPPLSGPYIAFLSLTQKYDSVFYVADSEYCAVNEVDDPYQGYPYWWDAYYKNLLPPLPSIQQRLDSRLYPTVAKGALEEYKLGSYLDSLFYFRDLWTTIGYKSFFTVWTQGTSANFLTPRRDLPDIDPPVLPVKTRFYNFNPAIDHPRIVSRFNWIYEQVKPNQWRVSENHLNILEQSMAAQVPAHLRSRVLLVSVRDNPYYVRRILSQVEQEQLTKAARLSYRLWRKLGCRALEAGGDYVDEDFIDDCHLSSSGGAKLMESVAAQVSEMANGVK